MRKTKTPDAPKPDPERDTMRPEYDFSDATRGATVERYARGTNIAVIDPDVLDVFPDSAAVNEALRALAPVLRRLHAAKPRKPRGGRGKAPAGKGTKRSDEAGESSG